jgi:hypothetical protein
MDEYDFSMSLESDANTMATPFPQPISWPWVPAVSGLYEWKRSIKIPTPLPIDNTPSETTDTADDLLFLQREELRLDVDGRYPQNVASGTSFFFLASQVHWIANLKSTGSDTWMGKIWYKDGETAKFPYTQIEVKVTPSWFLHLRSATVTFSGPGISNRTLTYQYRSFSFHTVEFEYDIESGITPVTEIETHAHPNRPGSLPSETLSIETVFRRCGFGVTKSGGDNVIAGPPPGVEGQWSDNEMHDAMQTHWSRFADAPQWSLWVLFASQHEQGSSLGGIMFDDIGPNHRQGTALFYNSFISNPPGNDPNPTAWVKRMQFWTAVHEMGHAFNLAHSWQKALGTPWIPLTNEPEARSFMNYPYNVAGGQTAFFSDFEFRFSDAELLFMRHAPSRFVQQGNADWFDHHGFEQHHISPEPSLKLDLRVNRSNTLFEFLEPVVLELKLTNISSQPQLISDKLLSELEHLMIIIKKDGKPARQFLPYAQYCWKSETRVLMPGESTYESLFVSVGKTGWEIAEPGYYTVQVALHLETTEEDIVSNPLRLRIAPPRGYEEEFLAQDFFSEDVGRILTFDGSRILTQGNNILREVAAKLSNRKVAYHAQVALASAMAKEYKILDLDNPKEPKIKVLPAHLPEASQEFSQALIQHPQTSAETLGHIDYKHYVDQFSETLAKAGESDKAANIQDQLFHTLAERNVLDRVLNAIKQRRDAYK